MGAGLGLPPEDSGQNDSACEVIRGAVWTGGHSGQLHPGLWPWPHVFRWCTWPRAISKPHSGRHGHAWSGTRAHLNPDSGRGRKTLLRRRKLRPRGQATGSGHKGCGGGTGLEVGMRGPKLVPQESLPRGSDIPGARGPTSPPLAEAVLTQAEPAPLGRSCGGST